MGHATFELVCALCQAWYQPAPAAPSPWGDALWQAEQVALIAEAAEAPRPVALSVAPAPRNEPSLGAQRSFADGRALRVNLTPTPLRCAPLVELTF